jgi:hypothetical protein
MRLNSFATLAGGEVKQGDRAVLGGQSSAAALRCHTRAQHVIAFFQLNGFYFGFGVQIPNTDFTFSAG